MAAFPPGPGSQVKVESVETLEVSANRVKRLVPARRQSRQINRPEAFLESEQ